MIGGLEGRAGPRGEGTAWDVGGRGEGKGESLCLNPWEEHSHLFGYTRHLTF